MAWPPLINDISTDRVQPPRFLVTPPSAPDYDARAVRGPTEQFYPDLTNLTLPRPPQDVFARVEALANSRGWHIAARSDGQPDGILRLQAVATSALLRFKDDVIVEVRPDGPDGSIVAMRSKSRLGKGDFGANAKRIRAFLSELH